MPSKLKPHGRTGKCPAESVASLRGTALAYKGNDPYVVHVCNWAAGEIERLQRDLARRRGLEVPDA